LLFALASGQCAIKNIHVHRCNYAFDKGTARAGGKHRAGNCTGGLAAPLPANAGMNAAKTGTVVIAQAETTQAETDKPAAHHRKANAWDAAAGMLVAALAFRLAYGEDAFKKLKNPLRRKHDRQP
jgi:hypothetical protein